MLKTRLLFMALTLALVIPAAGEEKAPLSTGQRFHMETSFGDNGFQSDSPTFGKQIPLYKTYDKATRVKLEKPTETGVAIETAIHKRESVRSFAGHQITLADLSRLLLSADGITHSRYGFQMRSAPSGGALYPVEIYIIASGVESLANGLYHFQVSDSSLELVKEGDFSQDAHLASNEQNSVGFSPLTVILTARFDRSTVKYADRGYRYTYMEAGAICQNIYLQATAAGLGTVAVGAFNDNALNLFLEIDGMAEAALMMMPVGYPAGD